MAKRKPKKPNPVSRARIMIGSIEINGQTFKGVHYERIEHADGTVTERGDRPTGLPENATLGDVVRCALEGVLKGKGSK
jgi:hypothetical protein